MLKTELQGARTWSAELARPDSSELRPGLQRPTLGTPDAGFPDSKRPTLEFRRRGLESDAGVQ